MFTHELLIFSMLQLIIYFNHSVPIYKIMGKILGSPNTSLEKKVILQSSRNERFLREKNANQLLDFNAYLHLVLLPGEKKRRIYCLVTIFIFLIKHHEFYLIIPTARNSLRRSSMLPLWIVNKAAAIWLMALAKQCMLLQCPEKSASRVCGFCMTPKFQIHKQQVFNHFTIYIVTLLRVGRLPALLSFHFYED